jgi:RNA-directed DNA polymerase
VQPPMAFEGGTESELAKRRAESPATEQWMEEVCERENCKQALRRVKANKGSPGIDGMTVEELSRYLKQQAVMQALQRSWDGTL